jgi:CheY-like chemotaxis protein
MPDQELTDTILRELQRALRYLYDPVELRKNHLIELLKIDTQDNPALALRRVITDTIQSMKPDAKVPHESNAWRIYQILSYRFVEQSSQKEVATDLALSIRQLRRLENAAVESLAETLLFHYAVETPPVILQQPQATPERPTAERTEDFPGEEQELEWLKQSYTRETINVPELISTFLKTTEPLAKNSNVVLTSSVPDCLPPISGQATSVRQAFLNVLTAAIRSNYGGEIQVNVLENGEWIDIEVMTSEQWSLAQEALEALNLASELVKLSGGLLKITDECKEGFFKVTLRLQKAEQIPILVIDDNKDALLLLERYLTGSHYRFIGVRDPANAITQAEECQPRIIVLDVMLPGIDGWELLGRLREHLSLGKAPVIVATILPQEALAMTLGAAGFIRKPVSREKFLAALDQQVALLEKESH